MTRHELTDEAVIRAAEELLAQVANDGRAATVTALANRLGVKRQTLYRNFGPTISNYLATDAARRTQAPRPRRNGATDSDTIARLRRENDELSRHLRIYEDHIRRLTIDNARLTAELNAARGVTGLAKRRQ